MSKRDSSGEPPKPPAYEVGYGKPPKKSQFQAGQSGNPRGRPRKAPIARPDPVVDNYLSDLFLDEGSRVIRLKGTGGVVEVSAAQAVVRAAYAKAINGDFKALLLVIDRLGPIQHKVTEDRIAIYNSAAEFVERARAEIKVAKEHGRPEPTFRIHPDDIGFDHRTLVVRHNGPDGPAERRLWDEMRARTAHFESQREGLEAQRQADPSPANEIGAELAKFDKLRRLTDQMFPDEETRRRPGFNLAEWQRGEASSAIRSRRKMPRG